MSSDNIKDILERNPTQFMYLTEGDENKLFWIAPSLALKVIKQYAADNKDTEHNIFVESGLSEDECVYIASMFVGFTDANSELNEAIRTKLTDFASDIVMSYPEGVINIRESKFKS